MKLYQHSLFLPFIAFTVYANEKQLCDSKFGPVCCDGYYRDLETANCKRCEPGYFDVNCSRTCGFPTYGERCQKICSCPETQCNFSYGCQLTISDSEKSISTELLNSEMRPRLVREKKGTSIKTYSDNNYLGKDRRTYSLITPQVIIGNESITLKGNSNPDNTKHSGIPGTIAIIALIISAALLLFVTIVIVALMRKYICRGKENRSNQRALVRPADLMTSEYDVLHNRNIFRGLADVTVEYSESSQSYSVHFTTQITGQDHSGLVDAEGNHVYLDLDNTRK